MFSALNNSILQNQERERERDNQSQGNQAGDLPYSDI